MTSTGHGEHDLGRMPSTDTANLAETFVSLARKLLGAPAVGDTLESVTLGDSNDIDVLVLLEDGGDLDVLLKEALGEGDLVGNGATIELDLHKVGLLLLKTGLADLGVGKDTDDSAVFADALELASNGLAAILSVLLGVAGEGLLLRAVPVLVEATLDLRGQVGSPDSGEGAEATRGLNVANNADNDHGGSLNDSHSLDNLTLVHLCRIPFRLNTPDKSHMYALEPGRSRSRTTWVIPAL